MVVEYNYSQTPGYCLKKLIVLRNTSVLGESKFGAFRSKLKRELLYVHFTTRQTGVNSAVDLKFVSRNKEL